jgi:hypothetical protein
MGRPPIHEIAMTPRERQRRRRERLRAEVDVERVLETLASEYRRAILADQDRMRTGVKRLMARWEREKAVSARWWRQRTAAAGRKRKKR